VIRVTEPSPKQVARFVDRCGTTLSYELVGATAGPLPAGWDHDEASVRLGRGERVWTRSLGALRSWKMFDMPWVVLHKPDAAQEVGTLVTFHSRQLGVVMLHACRIVTVIDEPDRVGFAYGTLAGHAVRGEEQFLVERDGSGLCTYSIRKFSLPNRLGVRLAGPLATRLQRRFTAESLAAMRIAVSASR
jgi:uncharacterized protein (UPF0548 family)